MNFGERGRVQVLTACMAGLLCSLAPPSLPAIAWQQSAPVEEFLTTSGEVGVHGGRLVVDERTEPKTLNPVTYVDSTSREVIRRMNADLIHINCQSQQSEPSLAKSWKVSADGRRYTLELRRGVRFSDGYPFNADDVVFSFRVYLDEKLHAPQRDLLAVGGKPVQVQKLDPYTIEIALAQPSAAAERIFDSVAILPRHLLEAEYQQGNLSSAWNLQTPRDRIAGLGPFRLKAYFPGQRLVLERNPFYWKMDRKGNRLPYLDEIDFLFAGNPDTQMMRFEAGESDVIGGISPENFFALEPKQQERGYHLYNLGPGLEYDFLFFNQNELPSGASAELVRRRRWFQDVKFRQAVSLAIDRESVVRLVYRGLAAPLWSHVTPGNRLWIDLSLAKPPRAPAQARSLLAAAGFRWNQDGGLADSDGQGVEFSIIVSAANALRTQISTILQSDLAQLGMTVHVVPLESRSLVDRVFKTFDYDACILGLISGDADPNPEMNVWLVDGSMHLWTLVPHQAQPWETEIDRLMRRQAITLNRQTRKQLYDRVQQLVQEDLPIICIVSPDVLVGGKCGLGNFTPTILGDNTFCNADRLFWRNARGSKPR